MKYAKAIYGALTVVAFLVAVIVFFVPVLFLLAATIPHDSSDLPSPSLFYATVFVSVILGFPVAWLIHCRLRGRPFAPRRKMARVIVASTGSAALGAFAAVLALAPFVAGESLKTTIAVVAYLGSIAGLALAFAVCGALTWRKWVSREP